MQGTQTVLAEQSGVLRAMPGTKGGVVIHLHLERVQETCLKSGDPEKMKRCPLSCSRSDCTGHLNSYLPGGCACHYMFLQQEALSTNILLFLMLLPAPSLH
ncbi:hypothetical protein F7725_016479 [Dissostichus mawsoni]|uniref:Uncharacterized protein n=1 Tax=Dissostichus mawsoni TaxID=36200 RepID=A0A7J5Z2E2_DISMA|nr:hypothetical protein F7725_016479 [Dissostichus mawsoni]